MGGVIIRADQSRPVRVWDMRGAFRAGWGTRSDERARWVAVPSGSQPLTEPAVMPETIWRWKNMNMTSGGTVTSRMSMNSRW